MHNNIHPSVRVRKFTFAPDDDDIFWQQVDKSAGPEGCWLWLGAQWDNGVPCHWVAGQLRSARTVAYEQSGVKIPPYMSVRLRSRTCQRECVNPAHLEIRARLAAS